MQEQEQDRVLLAMALVVDEATSLSLDSAEDRRELKRRLGVAILQANFRVLPPRKIIATVLRSQRSVNKS